MRYKTILTIALAVMLVGTLASTRAITATGSPDTEAEYEAPASDSGDPPGRPGWNCSRCGAECPAPSGRRGHGVRAPRGAKGRGGAFGHHGRAARGGGPGSGLAAERMLKSATKLELTDEQIGQLEKLTYNTRSKLIDLESEVEKARLEKHRQMETNAEDLTAMKKHLDSLAKIRVSIQVLKLEHWIDAKKVLTEDQKKLIKESYPRLGMRL
jgi:Spy/CpxP family protein refolding chaperone